jgi:hypothetical protein
MVFAGAFPLGLFVLPLAPLTPVPDKFPRQESDEYGRAKSKEVCIRVSEPRTKEDTH